MRATDSNFISNLNDLSKKHQRSIALPESTDPRVLQATIELLDAGLASTVALFGDRSEIFDIATQNSLDIAAVADQISWMSERSDLPAQTSHHYQRYLSDRQRNQSQQQVTDWGRMAINQAAWLVGEGQVDAGLAGCVATTAEVIRAALIHIGLAPEQNTISGSFAMIRDQESLPKAHYMFADCGVVIEPTAMQLVDIAAATVATFCQLFKADKPRVAFLSFSTKGSAQHPCQAKIAEASRKFQEKYPQIPADGDLQFDAAILPEVAHRKSPDSPVAGQANCFIFPNLDAGNIAYKMAQRLAFFAAYGPILQGTRRPFSDLSRGASVQDIKIAALIAMLRA